VCEGEFLGKGVGMGMLAGGTLGLRLKLRRSSWVEKWMESFRGIWFDRSGILSDVGWRNRVGEGCQHRVNDKVKIKVADRSEFSARENSVGSLPHPIFTG
jgi:hypothetical protein